MNIIFLDMDGVLNCSNEIEKWKKENDYPCFNLEAVEKFKQIYCLNPKGLYPYYIVPELLNRFNEMYSKIQNCRIVWSSSWRLTIKRDSKPFISGLYYQCGFPEGSFLSYTPELRNNFRADEILSWIKTFRQSYEINKCAIIDDLEEADPHVNEYLGLPIKFFKTEMETGLTQEIAENVLKYFNEEV